LGVCIGFIGLALVSVALLRWPLVWVLLGLGSVAWAFAWRRLHAVPGARADGP
jgi:chromate transporter